MKLKIVKNVGKKSGKEYLALQIDLGYRNVVLSFDSAVIAEVSGLSFADLHAIKIGEDKIIADVKLVK